VAWWSSGINSPLHSWLLHFRVTILGKLFTHVSVLPTLITEQRLVISGWEGKRWAWQAVRADSLPASGLWRNPAWQLISRMRPLLHFCIVFVRTKTLLSESLKETLIVAARDSRLTCGLYDCGQLLQMYATCCLLCRMSVIYIYFNTFLFEKTRFSTTEIDSIYNLIFYCRLPVFSA